MRLFLFSDDRLQEKLSTHRQKEAPNWLALNHTQAETQVVRALTPPGLFSILLRVLASFLFLARKMVTGSFQAHTPSLPLPEGLDMTAVG